MATNKPVPYLALQSIATYFDLSWLGFMRYLVEPSELRDHFMTTCMVGLCLNLGLGDSPEVVKGVSEAVTSTSKLSSESFSRRVKLLTLRPSRSAHGVVSSCENILPLLRF
jgi:hypothetical protein